MLVLVNGLLWVWVGVGGLGGGGGGWPEPPQGPHRMEGMGDRERLSGQGEVTGDSLRALAAMPAMLLKLRDFS